MFEFVDIRGTGCHGIVVKVYSAGSFDWSQKLSVPVPGSGSSACLSHCVTLV